MSRKMTIGLIAVMIIVVSLSFVLLVGDEFRFLIKAQIKDGTIPDEGSSVVIKDEGLEIAGIEDRQSLAEAEKRGLFILVNKENGLDADYEPDDLVEVKYFAKDRAAYGRKMRKEAAEAFNALAEAAMKEGYEIVVTTAYRSYDFQNSLYNSYVDSHGQEEADTFSARPGKSEHQTGLAADVSSPSVNYRLMRDYDKSPEGAWLGEHCKDFGFIIRFPKGKERITGYIYEPWHIRYVGEEAAKEMYEKNLTLEEYLQEIGLVESDE